MEFELRAWKPEDVDSVARYANNPKIAANLRDAFPYPYTQEGCGNVRRELCE